jgi:uncharacterized protein DUF4037
VDKGVDESTQWTHSEASFEPALQLNEGFYRDAVAPLLDGIPHAAARVGYGSEVLGFDTERSTDHGWGPKLHVFVAPDAVDQAKARIDAGLPDTYRDWPVRFGWDAVPVMHHVWVTTVRDYSVKQLGVDATQGFAAIDWLLTPQQLLLEATRGAVYHDDTGELRALRERLAYYPDDVWLWLIACQWRRIAQEEAFVGRTAEVGDELGSQVVAARVARDLMRLWFLFEHTYAPYSKWFGSGFAQLDGSAALAQCLSDTIAARDYPSREAALVGAYEIVAARHNELAITEPVDPSVRLFYGRPFQVLLSDRFADACVAALGDSPLARLPLVGSADQAADSTDVLSYADRSRQLRALYDVSGLT